MDKLEVPSDYDDSESRLSDKPSGGTDGQEQYIAHNHQHLSVPFNGSIRAPSPDTLSNLSADEYAQLRRQSHSPGSRYHGSSTPSSTGVKAKLYEFWVRNKGLALVLLSQAFGVLMNVFTRILEVEGNHGKGFDPFQVLFARMSITFILSTLYMWWTKTEDFPLGKKEVRSLLVARGLTGFFGVFGMYYSLLYLPLADATVLTFLAPSLACFACSILINEPFTRMEQLAAAVSFVGVVLIARPVSLFEALTSSVDSTHAPPASGVTDAATSATTTSIAAASAVAVAAVNGNSTAVETSGARNYYGDPTPAQRGVAVGVAMLGVLGAAGAYTTIRWIGKRAHPLISVNYFAAWCTIVSVVVQIAVPGIGFLLPSDGREWLLLGGLGLAGFIMQFLLAAGLQYEKSSRATNMVYVQMLFALAGDKLVFGQTPGALSIVGSSLILGSAIYVAVHKEGAGGKTNGRERGEGRGSGGDEERGLMEGADLDDGESNRRPVQEIQLRTIRV
ncbi:hypothetical protein BDY21DRAFT_278912 [Lineolata rhizophorae]|uniref:EamA domain-containing protein n=1 Tax=Lineolata rhizophorae TaxID=578093 RepID=A0A6A6PBE4_9PEZI|nr:hypothetical protein BDY21DRAFT_278912 [Lineolata rhizophorae]